MSSGFPPQDLGCPEPDECTVAIADLVRLAGENRLPQATSSAGRHWFRVYDARDGYAQPNPGFGDTRFAPFDAQDTGARVPTMYLAESLEAALLETSLHNVYEDSRLVSEQELLGKLHARVVPPRDLTLVDLRDECLATLSLTRQNVSSSSSEHYPCTRRVAQAIHAGPLVDGIIWHSRQAELAERPPVEVVVVFADRVPHARTSWNLASSRSSNGPLLEGTGRLLLDELAEALDVTITAAPTLDDPDSA